MHKRNNKKYFIVVVLLLLVGISIGYAFIITTFNITGKSNIRKNSWDIHFENIVVRNGSVEAIKLPTINNKATVDFEVKLNLPGDFYEFTIDVVNDGTIDAMIDSIVKTPNLTDGQKKYLNYIIEYQNGEEITKNQLIEKESYLRLKIKIEYKKDIMISDLPGVAENLTLGFTLNNIQADDSRVIVKNHGIITSNGDINEIGTIVTIGTELFYTIGTEENNVKLLSMYNLYVGNNVNINGDVTPLINPTGIQSELAKGWIGGPSVAIGTTAFSSINQKETNYNDYNGSIIEKYVNNYQNYLETNFDVDIREARLISYNELTNQETFACKEKAHCSRKYPWIYSTSYWTGTSFENTYIWRIHATGTFATHHYYGDDSYGERPVIVISKDYF